VASDPVRDWSSSLLILGAIVLVFAVGLSIAEALVSGVSERDYAFSSFAPAGIGVAAVLLLAGAVLRGLSARRPQYHDARRSDRAR
jgi:hypothetical protein